MAKTLLILAAGTGSRFGGLKQLSPVGPSGEFIIDYSISDALKYGFDKVVFVIKKENYEDFRETIGKRIEKNVKVEYVFQTLDTLPKKVEIAREKPLGTGHALYCAKDYIDGPFVLISADDFYGQESFEVLSKFLDKDNDKVGVLGHNLASTINNPEGVKRGVIFEEDGEISSILECKVTLDGDYINAEELQGTRKFRLSKTTVANMLIFAFSYDIFPLLEKRLNEFLDEADLTKDEFYLNRVIDGLIKEHKIEMLTTKEKWMGMTYKEDALQVQEHIKEEIKKGKYKEDLWSK